MDRPRNDFKRALFARETQIGLFLGLAHEYPAEIIATTGFDWLMIDAEHGPNDLQSILRQLQVLAPYPVRPAVRCVDHNPARIKRLLDIGVQTLMVPSVESADQARGLVRAMRYPPAGVRGVGAAMARAARWNGVSNYFANADEEMCLIVQIETLAGVAALEEIVAVEGVDAVFIGPSDLAAAMDHLGQPNHPQVKAAVENAIKRTLAGGKAVGAFSADPALVAAYLGMGASFVLVGVDTLLLRNAASALVAQFKSAGAKPGAAY